MEWNLLFFLNSVLLGVGLAIDAFSVSLANGLGEPEMRVNKMCVIAGVFGFFQALMPMAGWLCVHTILRYFREFEKWIPWIALGLLLFLGGKMLVDGLGKGEDEAEKIRVGAMALFIQGIATSIDALSVGFTIASYGLGMAIVCALIIAVVTYFLSMTGLIIGKKMGTKLTKKASVLGGVILILIGVEIFVTGVL